MSDTITASDFSSAASSLSSSGGTDSTTSTQSQQSTSTTDTQNSSFSGQTTGESASVSAEAPQTDQNVSVQQGQPPRERWDSILENARRKAREEVESQYQEIQWARQIDRGELEAARAWMDLGNRNPMLALDQLLNGIIQSSPQARAQVERYVQNLFAQGQGQRHVDDDPAPEPDIPTDQSNGQPVVYSAQQMQKLLAWQQRQLTKQFQQEMQQQVGPIQAERAAQQQQRMVETYSKQAVGAVRDLPGFNENKVEITRIYAQMPLRDGRTEGEKLRDAYLQVVGKKLQFQGRQQAVQDITRKAGATTVNPASGNAGQQFDYKNASWEDALRHEWNLRNGKK